MNLRRLFDLNDINYWLLVSGFALDAVLTFIILILLLQFLAASGGTLGFIQMGLMVAIFLGNFATAWIVGKMASDLRGPTYGLISSMSSAAIILVVMIPAGGIFGFLAAIVALAGGFNGGIASLPRPKKP